MHMYLRRFRLITLTSLLLVAACGSDDDDTPGQTGSGGASGSGGRGGASGQGGSGTGGQSGSGGGGTASGGSGGGGGGAGSGGVSGSGGAGAGDASSPDTSGSGGSPGDASGGEALPPAASGQGPVAPGRIVYSQDFEMGMAGISRSPNGLPEDRAVIVDDPLQQRGKVMKVEWRAGDNFRTSGGTEPRSWISNRPGHEFPPGTNVSHAFGFMTTGGYMDYCFGQIISSGGPVWMLIGEGEGTLTVFCNTCGGNTRHMKLEPNRWYDFRVDMDFRVGGAVKFYINGEMFRMGQVNSTRGTIAHWDGGIYNRAAGTQSNRTRTVFISNLSIGIRE
jgi:hypothetical protein